ncbi:MAG TPA: hypothetical protein VFG86_21940 [Chloroflexota bacterium]|nr:hypothetical protein [Chloroflexota bacterium]
MNALVQVILIWRLRFPTTGDKWKYCLLAVAAPLAVLVAMRLLVAGGVIHARVAEQTMLERWLTVAASVLLLVSPWLVTAAAIMNKKRRAALQE